ncbi:arg-6 mitochondrial precursor [Pseudohyphozyma bogoriensis]|nr:arg-6 mitochondrial precursor [Pseudohyphozyma bogoriensis]
MPTLPTEILGKIISDPILTWDDLEKLEAAARGSRTFTSIIHTFGRYPLEIKVGTNGSGGVVTRESALVWLDLLSRDRFRLVKPLSSSRYSQSYAGPTHDDLLYISSSMTFLSIIISAKSLSTLCLDLNCFMDENDLRDTDGYDSSEDFLNELKAPTFHLSHLTFADTTPAQSIFTIIAGASASTLRHLSIPLMRRTPTDPNLITDLYPSRHAGPNLINVLPLLATLPTSPTSRRFQLTGTVEAKKWNDELEEYCRALFRGLPTSFTTLDLREFAFPDILVEKLALSITRIGLKRSEYDEEEQSKMIEACEQRGVELVWDVY